MANSITSERLWVLDTAAEINGVGEQTWITRLYYVPAAADNACTIQEYSSAGVLRTAAYIKAGATDASPVDQPYNEPGPRYFNGFKLSAISGGVLYVYLAPQNTK